MLILGIDVGTSCGWALLRDGDRVCSGCWKLDVPDGEPDGYRFALMRRSLIARCADMMPDAIAYEHPLGLKGHAERVIGGLVGVLAGFACEFKLPLHRFAPSALKQLATGRGVATKFEMTEAAVRLWRFRDITGDDEADALFCALALWKEHS